MAETKTKSGGSRRSSTSRPNGSRASRSAGPRGNGSSASKAKGGSKARAAKAAAEEQVSSAQEIVSEKGPALVGGAAALAGLAGAVALAINGRTGKSRSLSDAVKKRRRKTTRKALGATTRALGKTAVEVGKAGYRVGELTAEVRRVREQASQKN
jgi:hypothetical protein